MTQCARAQQREFRGRAWQNSGAGRLIGRWEIHHLQCAGAALRRGSGEVLIDGQNVRDVTLQSLRQSMALVSQDPAIFSDTVRNNIALGRLTASEAEIVEAAKAAARLDRRLQLRVPARRGANQRAYHRGQDRLVVGHERTGRHQRGRRGSTVRRDRRVACRRRPGRARVVGRYLSRRRGTRNETTPDGRGHPAGSVSGRPAASHEGLRQRVSRHGVVPTQVLLTPYDFVMRRQYLHARKTLTRLLKIGCVPIVNENDAIADDEIRFGDNDRIAALVSHLIKADVLVLLTDTDGLYTADRRTDASAALISVDSADDPMLHVQAGSNRGHPRQRWNGIEAGCGPDCVVVGGDGGHRRATGLGCFATPGRRHRCSRHGVPAPRPSLTGPQALDRLRRQDRPVRIVVDDGARTALTQRGTSLLPAGITDVVGNVRRG